MDAIDRKNAIVDWNLEAGDSGGLIETAYRNRLSVPQLIAILVTAGPLGRKFNSRERKQVLRAVSVARRMKRNGATWEECLQRVELPLAECGAAWLEAAVRHLDDAPMARRRAGDPIPGGVKAEIVRLYGLPGATTETVGKSLCLDRGVVSQALREAGTLRHGHGSKAVKKTPPSRKSLRLGRTELDAQEAEEARRLYAEPGATVAAVALAMRISKHHVNSFLREAGLLRRSALR